MHLDCSCTSLHFAALRCTSYSVKLVQGTYWTRFELSSGHREQSYGSRWCYPRSIAKQSPCQGAVDEGIISGPMLHSTHVHLKYPGSFLLACNFQNLPLRDCVRISAGTPARKIKLNYATLTWCVVQFGERFLPEKKHLFYPKRGSPTCSSLSQQKILQNNLQIQFHKSLANKTTLTSTWQLTKFTLFTCPCCPAPKLQKSGPQAQR